MNRRRIIRGFTMVLLAGYFALLAAMALAPERLGQPALPGSRWSLLLMAAALCYCGQIVMVLLFALVPGRERGR